MKSFEKMRNYFESYTREKYFQDRIKAIRKKIDIPLEGVKLPDGFNASSLVRFQGPVSVFGIKLDHLNYQTSPNQRDTAFKELIKPIPSIYQTMSTVLFINAYILYNERFYKVFESFFNRVEGPVSLTEFRNDFLEHEASCEDDLCPNEDYLRSKSKQFPVMIGISPLASQNEVIDLIKDRWDYIQYHFSELVERRVIPPFQSEKLTLSKLRKRGQKSREIEDIVYENKKASLKKLGALIKEKTGHIFDPGEIGKIRSLAIKRRESDRK